MRKSPLSSGFHGGPCCCCCCCCCCCLPLLEFVFDGFPVFLSVFVLMCLLFVFAFCSLLVLRLIFVSACVCISVAVHVFSRTSCILSYKRISKSQRCSYIQRSYHIKTFLCIHQYLYKSIRG